MTIRKPNLSQHIHELEIEMENRQIFLQCAIDETIELKEKDDAGLTTKKDQKRAAELQDIMKSHKSWIDAHKKEITDYYKPAVVIAC